MINNICSTCRLPILAFPIIHNTLHLRLSPQLRQFLRFHPPDLTYPSGRPPASWFLTGFSRTWRPQKKKRDVINIPHKYTTSLDTRQGR